MKVEINEYDKEWQKVAGQSFTMQKSFFNPHDFAISRNYYVFFQNALSFKMSQYLLGLRGPAQCVNFDEGPMKVHVVPRHGGKPMVIDNVQPAFLIHHANAYEDGDEIVVWSSGWSPEAVHSLATTPGSGMLGSWKVVMDGDFNDVPVSSLWSHRINTKTGEVRRRCLFAQSNDHPRVNPSFYSMPTRYCYVNMCMTDDADPAAQPDHREPVPLSSDVVPTPERLGKTWQSIPDEVLHTSASEEESDFSWTTKAASSVTSVLPTDSPPSVPQSRHALAPRDLTPYTSVLSSVGGVPVQPTRPLKQSILTAKERLKKLSKLELSILSLVLDVPRAQGRQQDQKSQAEAASPDAFSISIDEDASMDEDEDEDGAFPVSAKKMAGRNGGSTREMGSLEWLNLSSVFVVIGFVIAQAFTKVDTHTGEAQTWFPGKRCFCEELIFVPGPNGETKEDDGHLLGLVYNAAKHRSFLAILDAADFSKGPVAKIWLKNHVPHGLHGFFSPKYYGPSA
ncbi:hypothetical protein ABBQ32_012798 [Trebouxia sp. C0010 RCD-2024]